MKSPIFPAPSGMVIIPPRLPPGQAYYGALLCASHPSEGSRLDLGMILISQQLM